MRASRFVYRDRDGEQYMPLVVAHRDTKMCAVARDRGMIAKIIARENDRLDTRYLVVGQIGAVVVIDVFMVVDVEEVSGHARLPQPLRKPNS